MKYDCNGVVDCFEAFILCTVAQFLYTHTKQESAKRVD